MKISKETLSISMVIILFIILFTISSIAFKACKNEFEKEVDNLESRIGTKIIINQDTLLIIDCSILNNSYTLEDGREISYKLVKKLENK